MLRILIVEDDDELRLSLALSLRRAGHRVLEAGSAATARPQLANIELLLTDLRLPDDQGTSLLLEGQRLNPQLQTILMTGHATIESAILATRNGARDYLLKPFEMAKLKQLVAEVDRLFEHRRDAATAPSGLVGNSPAMQRVWAAIETAAASQAPVLIEGETGTGKELVATAIHQRCAGREQPLVAVNLAAMPSGLIDSELFGFERGAFTGAHGAHKGRFALAGSGTLFLDEINSMPLEVQPKLLRALETREVWPVGAEKPQRLSARIIAASNQPLLSLIEQGRFRSDLFYRLNVLHISLPPLRECTDDLPLLVRSLLDRSEIPRRSPLPVEVAPEAIAWLQQQPWPGNVRELKNLLERALLQSPALSRNPPRLELSDLHAAPTDQATLPFKEAQSAASEVWTRSALLGALQKTGGNRAQAAKLLQMNRTALFKLMKKLGIQD